MYLVGHTALGVAAVTALGIGNPALALAVGWLSHYVADFFPHGDEPLGKWAKRGNEVRRLALIFVADFLVVVAVWSWLVSRIGWSWPLAFAAFGSAIPDALWGFEMVAKRDFTGWLGRFHQRNHNYFHVDLPLWVGLVAQTALSATLWLWAAR